MFTLLAKRRISEVIVEVVVSAPMIARAAQPGNFVLVRGDERGERIPLTIADSDAHHGTITLVMQEIGAGTRALAAFDIGQYYLDVVGPLGKDRIPHGGGKTICCVCGGVGLAPMFPQMKAHHAAGNRVISILGARNSSLLFWQDKVEAISERVIVTTDDGSAGRKGYAAQVLDDLVSSGEKIDEVIAIGPVPHMKAVTECCKRHNLPVVVSLNPIMVDGTGMCGGCRVTVGGEVKYACVDGPEFDGAAVDFDELVMRQRTYRPLELSVNEGTAKGPENGHACLFEQQVKEMEAALSARKKKHYTRYFEEVAALTILESMAELVKHRSTFEEVKHVFSPEEAMAEAPRCRGCEMAPCVDGCPVEVDIRGFIRAIQEGDIARAARIIKDKNNLPAVCGRVCPQEKQCEQRCVVGKSSERPVAIGSLERFVADWEAANVPREPFHITSNGRKVAVIGCGPGGLTCAGDLARQGYGVTVFEAFHDTGGVLRYGIPEFRLPKVIVDREVEYIKSLGVRIELNMVIGKVLTIEGLFKNGYEAVFIAVGAGAPVFMDIPGESLVGVYSANEFLTRVNLMKAYRFGEYQTPVIIGERVAVIGAGNVAMDAARVAVRLGAKRVSLVYRRSEAEMPARAEEIEHAKEEGVELQLLTAPVRLIGDEQGRVCAMECVRMELGEPDASGRRRPVKIVGSEFMLECDMVIPALGSRSNPLLTGNTKGIQLNKWGNIVADPVTGATNLPGVFAGGDIVTGAATVIEAMGAGKRAARAIDEYLSGQSEAARSLLRVTDGIT
ncbi:MAG: NADPH-dependent glutamate synthase [Candidatus Hydrogenedentes bacterium]|nr:NADPH-dependent glutamate synthase [Candidatus Hydrogenedentota bacterium]